MKARNQVLIIFERGPVRGEIEAAHGKVGALRIVGGGGKAEGTAFAMTSKTGGRLLVRFAEATTANGACATRVTVKTRRNPFTFFLRDVKRQSPIFIPEYGVIVTTPDETRGYAEVADAVRARGLVSQLAAIEGEPEETYEEACRQTRNLVCPTWLGLSRDMRIFEVSPQENMGYWGYVQPRYHSTLQSAPETENQAYKLAFTIGPGVSCRVKITRRLEDGVLPILRSTQVEDDVLYDVTAFATLETQPIGRGALRGSDWQACYPNTGGNMLTAGENAGLKGLLDREMRGREEETLCWVRVVAANQGAVPRYAWFRGLQVELVNWKRAQVGYNSATGFASFNSGLVFGVHRLNGEAAPQLELAVLLQPKETAIYDILVPHQAVSEARARKLAGLDFARHLAACRRFWNAKLKSAASVSLPEPAIDERLRAGLLHCDLVALGKEPRGPVLATIGWYAPIGSESSPIIQFFDSMGWHDLAERSLQFFLERQRADGFIQNFGGYQLETGPALWTMGEHFRYTRDKAWVRRIKPNLLKACEFLLAWRERNKRKELRGKGYGLLDGKVADPEDFFHSFMLNGLSYIGIARVGEMLADVDPSQSKRLAAEARAFRKDIRTAYYESVGRSPAIPLSDGTWTPTMPPWSEYPGPLALFADGGNWFTHGAVGARDSLIGSLYLVISEVLDANEPGADVLLKTHQQLFTVRNAGLSQPYYCRHDYIHLARGEVKAFLKTYYNQFSSLQDRQTYTFWEHYFHVSQHKTHEEGWFLMQTRWMLLMEEGDKLHMLRAIPRRWMEHGKHIAFKNLKTHFGPVSLRVESKLKEGLIEARYSFAGDRRPKSLFLRLPHPAELRPRTVNGGKYHSATESVEIRSPKAAGTVALHF